MIKFFSFSLSIIFIAISTSFFNEDKIQKKVLRVDNFDIECFVSLKTKKKFEDNKVYYWYKSGEIHNSVASAGGNVLHSKYSKFYRSNQLAEQGEFDYGLKNGVWQTWNENGTLKERVVWKSGLKNGSYIAYDSIGSPIEKGNYKKGIKNGAWVNLKTKDTISYNKGAVILPEVEDQKEGFFKRLFKKKNKDKTIKNTTKSNLTTKKEKPKKDGFFKRLFKKKDNTKAKKKN